MALSGYRLSLKADSDLEEIFEHTLSEFVEDQAFKYLFEFEELFFHLVDYPEIGRSRNEIKRGLRSLSKSAHAEFFRIMANHIRIVRILHGSKDITQFLE